MQILLYPNVGTEYGVDNYLRSQISSGGWAICAQPPIFLGPRKMGGRASLRIFAPITHRFAR